MVCSPPTGSVLLSVEDDTKANNCKCESESAPTDCEDFHFVFTNTTSVLILFNEENISMRDECFQVSKTSLRFSTKALIIY